ncbi:MAG: hypothetical protein JO263_09565 [Candidatus Eremiobacteraeota bacterium]|nr:hypothetical protein [Candidatus Eremiobacteraeota bacterium]
MLLRPHRRFTRASHFTLPKQQRGMYLARFLVATAAILVTSGAPAYAERPIVDLHRLDAYFELFAGDTSVPWKPATVRLDTYSSAPVSFSVYQADPTDVLTAGANSAARPIATSGRHPALSFTFNPPGGYQFQSNEVTLPLGAREGFFVVEARRGNVGEQVWINRSRVGILAKATPNSLVVYGTDLGTGMPLSRMRVQFVVNRNFATMLTNGDGIAIWNRSTHPVFVLAQWGNSYGFLSLLPQPPLPTTVVGLRTDSAVVHAGGTIHVAGFARTRERGVLHPSRGSVQVTIHSGARAMAQQRVALDEAGAFVASFAIPPETPAGDYAVLAQAAGGVGGTTIHVDGNAGELSLEVGAACPATCDDRQDLPLRLHSSRGDVVVQLSVIRSPHIDLSDSVQTFAWGTTRWFESAVRTDDRGDATILVPRPNDGLASTYGVHAEAQGATADTRVMVPTADAIVRVQVDRNEQSVDTPITFDVAAVDRDGRPLSNMPVTVQLTHGTAVAQQTLTLDSNGRVRGVFASPQLGTSLILASVDHAGRAMDAAQVQVDPQATSGSSDGRSGNVRISLDKDTYRSDEAVTIRAGASNAVGKALITFESATGTQAQVVPIARGEAVARLRALNAAGDLRIGAAVVRDGQIEWNTVPVVLAAAGRPQTSRVTLASAEFAPGEAAKISLDGTNERATMVVRISRVAPSGSATFASAPALLSIGAAATQNSAAATPTWHPWVNSTGDHAQVLGFVRRTQPPIEVSLPQADTESVSWSALRSSTSAVPITLPLEKGEYTLSILAICDDGSVASGSSTILVR